MDNELRVTGLFYMKMNEGETKEEAEDRFLKTLYDAGLDCLNSSLQFETEYELQSKEIEEKTANEKVTGKEPFDKNGHMIVSEEKRDAFLKARGYTIDDLKAKWEYGQKKENPLIVKLVKKGYNWDNLSYELMNRVLDIRVKTRIINEDFSEEYQKKLKRKEQSDLREKYLGKRIYTVAELNGEFIVHSSKVSSVGAFDNRNGIPLYSTSSLICYEYELNTGKMGRNGYCCFSSQKKANEYINKELEAIENSPDKYYKKFLFGVNTEELSTASTVEEGQFLIEKFFVTDVVKRGVEDHSQYFFLSFGSLICYYENVDTNVPMDDFCYFFSSEEKAKAFVEQELEKNKEEAERG